MFGLFLIVGCMQCVSTRARPRASNSDAVSETTQHGSFDVVGRTDRPQPCLTGMDSSPHVVRNSALFLHFVSLLVLVEVKSQSWKC